MVNTDGKPADTYHHGDLKNELIYKGIYLLTKEGYDALTLRKLAAFCNVSHAAPYKHFKSKEDLIFAISEKIADEFSENLALSFLSAGDPKERLTETVVQYIKFMKENPDYFRFVFMVDHGRPVEWGEEAIYQNKPLSLIMQAAKLYIDPANKNKEQFLKVFLELWCLIQGFTLLLVNRTIKDENYISTSRTMLEDFLKGR